MHSKQFSRVTVSKQYSTHSTVSSTVYYSTHYSISEYSQQYSSTVHTSQFQYRVQYADVFINYFLLAELAEVLVTLRFCMGSPVISPCA